MENVAGQSPGRVGAKRTERAKPRDDNSLDAARGDVEC